MEADARRSAADRPGGETPAVGRITQLTTREAPRTPREERGAARTAFAAAAKPGETPVPGGTGMEQGLTAENAAYIRRRAQRSGRTAAEVLNGIVSAARGKSRD